jgi:hypothetical protein
MADEIIDAIGLVVVDLLGVLVDQGSQSRAEDRERSAADERREALAGVDLLLLAALHDRVITESERAALAGRVPELLKKARRDASDERVQKLEARWSKWRADSTENEFRQRVERRASRLQASSKKAVYEAVKHVLTVEPPSREATYRSKGRSDPEKTLRLFAELLGQ